MTISELKFQINVVRRDIAELEAYAASLHPDNSIQEHWDYDLNEADLADRRELLGHLQGNLAALEATR